MATLEETVLSLVAEVKTLTRTVEEKVSAAQREVSVIRAALGFDFYVSSSAADSETSATSIAGIQTKIEAAKIAAPTRIFTVFVASFLDSFPVALSSSNVIWKFSDSNILNPPTGTKLFIATGSKLIVSGLRVEFVGAANPASVVVENRAAGQTLYMQRSIVTNAASPYQAANGGGPIERQYNPT